MRQCVSSVHRRSGHTVSKTQCFCCSVTQWCLTLQPHGLQCATLPCPSLSPGACSNSCPSSRWYHPAISSSVAPFFSYLQSYPASGSFPMSWLLVSRGQVLELQLQPQSFQWIFRLVSFRIDWFDLLAAQGTLKSLLQHHSSKASILWCSAFFMIQLSHPYVTSGINHRFDYMDLCWQSNVSAFEYAV